MMKMQIDGTDGADHLNNELQSNLNGQRDQNVTVKARISETDMQRTEAIAKLRVM